MVKRPFTKAKPAPAKAPEPYLDSGFTPQSAPPPPVALATDQPDPEAQALIDALAQKVADIVVDARSKNAKLSPQVALNALEAARLMIVSGGIKL